MGFPYQLATLFLALYFARGITEPMSKPTVLIVSGAAHTPKHFEPLKTLLESSKYDVYSPRLPSNSIYPPDHSYQRDVDTVREIAEQLAQEEKRIIVLMHSYGGFVGTDALAGLGLEARARQGLRGGIEWLAYMTAWLPAKGQGINDTSALSADFQTQLSMIGVNGRISLIEDPEIAFYHDLSPEALETAVAELTAFSQDPNTARVQNEAWRDINVAYLKCTQDRAIPPNIQQAMIGQIRDQGIEVELTCCNASHTPYLSQPQTVLNWIDSLGVGENERRNC